MLLVGLVLGRLLHRSVRRVEADAVEVAGHGALGLGDAHAVVVEDHQHLAIERAGVVQSLHGEAVDDAGVAEEGHHAAPVRIVLGERFASQPVSARHAHRGRDRGAGVSDRCLLYTSPSPRDGLLARMPSSA